MLFDSRATLGWDDSLCIFQVLSRSLLLSGHNAIQWKLLASFLVSGFLSWTLSQNFKDLCKERQRKVRGKGRAKEEERMRKGKRKEEERKKKGRGKDEDGKERIRFRLPYSRYLRFIHEIKSFLLLLGISWGRDEEMPFWIVLGYRGYR